MYFYRLKLLALRLVNLYKNQGLWLEFLVMFQPSRQSSASLVHLRFPFTPPSTHFPSRPCWTNTGGYIGHMWPVCFGEGAAGCISVPASSLCRRDCRLICPVKGGAAGLRCTEAAAPRWRTVDSFFPVVACSTFSAQTGRIPLRRAAWGEWRGENRGRKRRWRWEEVTQGQQSEKK